jgi:hypothetical protein
MPLTSEAIFIHEDGCYLPTERARSPWSDTMVHGGPVAGLLAHAVERFAVVPEMRVVRLTVDLFRPVPMAALSVAARSARDGRRIRAVDAVLLCGEAEVARASGLLLRPTETPSLVTGAAPLLPPGPETLEPRPLVPLGTVPRRTGFHTTVEFRRVPAQPGAPVTAWVHMPVPLIEGEELTPLVRVAACADFVNPLAGGSRPGGVGYINTDSTIHLHRLPAGEWIGMQVTRNVEAGIGVATAMLFDEVGPIGRGTQCALANEVR